MDDTGWVSVKDQPHPTKQNDVIVFMDGKVKYAGICSYFGLLCWRTESGRRIDDDRITHWRYMPEPPTEASK